MPDPAKSLADIDDVLSSIRRLVSDQPDRGLPDGGEPLSISAHAGEETGPAPTDKLLLTPALRVADGDAPNTGDGGPGPAGPGTDTHLVEAESPTPDPAPHAADDSTVDAEDVTPSDMRLDMPDADDTTSVVEASDGAGDIGHATEPTPPSDTERAVGSDGWRAEMRLYDWQSGETRGATDDPAASIAPVRDFEPESDDADWPDTGTHRALLDLAAARAVPAPDASQDGSSVSEGSDRAAAASQQVAGAGKDASNVTRPADARPAFSRRTDPVSAVSSPTDPRNARRPATVTLNPFSAAAGSEVRAEEEPDDWDYDDAFAGISDNQEDGDDAAQRDASELPGGPATRTSEAGRAGEAAAPPFADRDLAAGTEREGASDTQPMSDTMILHSPITPGTSAPTDEADAPATTILDEETLRRIVAEVVREELQGALGERITRNIRKLVRREIRLVLASDEAD
jgi:hypothetical protein